MASEVQSKQTSVLLAEYERVYTEIMDMQRKSETLFGFGLTGIGASLIYGIKGEVPGIFAIATIFALVLILYIAVCYCVIMSLGGYKQYLEEAINQHTNSGWLVWEGHITKPILQDPWPMKVLWMIMLLLPILTFRLSFSQGNFASDGLQWAYIVLAAGIFAACVKSAIRLRTVSKLAYDTAQGAQKAANAKFTHRDVH